MALHRIPESCKRVLADAFLVLEWRTGRQADPGTDPANGRSTRLWRIPARARRPADTVSLRAMVEGNRSRPAGSQAQWIPLQFRGRLRLAVRRGAECLDDGQSSKRGPEAGSQLPHEEPCLQGADRSWSEVSDARRSSRTASGPGGALDGWGQAGA